MVESRYNLRVALPPSACWSQETTSDFSGGIPGVAEDMAAVEFEYLRPAFSVPLLRRGDAGERIGQCEGRHF